MPLLPGLKKTNKEHNPQQRENIQEKGFEIHQKSKTKNIRLAQNHWDYYDCTRYFLDTVRDNASFYGAFFQTDYCQ